MVDRIKSSGLDGGAMEFKSFSSLAEIPSAAWDELQHGDFPFSRHAYLRALETSGSVGEGAGWTPLYFTLWDQGRLTAATYLYLKNHSYGEYIFDWEWAEAYARSGVAYYPKLVSAVPFTPATGPKLLLHPGADSRQCCAALIRHARDYVEAKSLSGLHFLFLPREELPYFKDAGFLVRHSYQFHWKNSGYENFNDFLATLKHKRRSEIRRERRAVQMLPIGIERLIGGAISSEHMDAMYGFYLDTIRKKGGIPYLTREFFQQVWKGMRSNLVLVLAKDKEKWVAGSIFYQEGACLYGRYWGCDADYPNLHFELCYYQGIEHAVLNKLRLFEAGAQGSHKTLRGFNPELTYSAHWIGHPGFREAIGRYIEEEKKILPIA